MGKRQDLTGKTFGDWSVLGFAGGGKWHCKCTCGTEKDIPTNKLTSGQTLSCGHNKIQNLVGQRFGEWEVLSYSGNMRWLCRCSCGVEREVLGKNLRDGKTTSCGHAGSLKRIDLVDKQFGDLKVLKYAGNKKWLCECSCGNKKEILGSKLRSGQVTSCGHTSGFKDLTNSRFGKLLVEKYIGDGKYLCRCDCGNTVEIRASNLRNNSTNSCGCIKETKFTKEYIVNILNSYKSDNGFYPTRYEIASILDISYGYVCKIINEYSLQDYIDNSYRSHEEREIYDYIQSLSPELQIEHNKRGVLSGNRELDIYIPSKRIAIEYNGNYWHSDKIRNKTYHQDKTLEYISLGIHLIHIFEYEWNNDIIQEKLKLYIKDLVLGYSNRVYAKNCEVRPVDSKSERQFLESYHLQGWGNSDIALGLWQSSRLLSVMTFGKPRFNGKFQWEMIRYCTLPGTTIIGGGEKLFKYFIDKYNPNSIISYSDISKFTGKIYNRLGFVTDDRFITEPSYIWVKGNDVRSRYSTQKNKLLSAGLGKYGNTEAEIMNNLGYLKIYNCGNRRYEWRR